MAKTYTTRGLSYHISYSADDLATHFGVHVQTIREWVRRGLQPIDEHTPALFLGTYVMRFIDDMNSKRKTTTQFNEFYCMSCHAAHNPFNNTVVITTDNNGFIRATGICEQSGAHIHKTYKLCDMSKIHQQFTVVDTLRLYDSGNTTLNTHFSDTEKSTQTHVQTDGEITNNEHST